MTAAANGSAEGLIPALYVSSLIKFCSLIGRLVCLYAFFAASPVAMVAANLSPFSFGGNFKKSFTGSLHGNR